MLGRVSEENLSVCTMMLEYLHDIRLIMQRPHRLGLRSYLGVWRLSD